MIRIKGDELKTEEDWANVLGEILDEAKAALLENNSDKLLEIQAALDEFVKKSPPYCRVLDDIATRATQNIFISGTNESLRKVVEGSAELKKTLELIKGTTARMKKSRKAILFEGVIETLNKAEIAINELKNIGETFDENEKSLLEKIGPIGKSIEKVRDEITALDKKKKKKEE
jgi:transketolase